MDKEIYGGLWQHLKPRIMIEGSLELIAPGIKDRQTGSDIHSGCRIVQHLVATITSAGVASVFGIIDWDTDNLPANHVDVLSHGKRYSLETLILDPRLLGALLLHTPGLDDKCRTRLGFGTLTYSTYRDLSDKKLLQTIVTAIAAECFPKASADAISVTYLDDVSLEISKHFLAHPGHRLAETVLPSIFPWLGVHGKRPGDLAKYMLSAVIKDASHLLPRDILDTFQEILSHSAH
jgi:hypothetical protein